MQPTRLQCGWCGRYHASIDAAEFVHRPLPCASRESDGRIWLVRPLAGDTTEWQLLRLHLEDYLLLGLLTEDRGGIAVPIDIWTTERSRIRAALLEGY